MARNSRKWQVMVLQERGRLFFKTFVGKDHGRQAQRWCSDGQPWWTVRCREKDTLESEGRRGEEGKAQAGSQGQTCLKGSSERTSGLLRATKKLLAQVQAAQRALHHCLAGRGDMMSHWHSRTGQTSQRYGKTPLSALCYIRTWLAELCEVPYGWPGGFAHQATRPLVWKLTTNIQNEVRVGLASSMFIKDWDFGVFLCFFFLPSHK